MVNEVEEYCKVHGIKKTTPAQYRAILSFLARMADVKRRLEK